MMKKCLVLLIILLFCGGNVFAKTFKNDYYSIKDLKKMGIIANSPIKKTELEKTKLILKEVQIKTDKGVQQGKGPFYAIIYDDKGNIISESSNSVVEEQNCLYHAEIYTIKKAHEKLKTYDLAPYNPSIYINAEPCIMCMGAIMWSGIKTIYYGVPSKDVEKITGFDEGYKPNWLKEFKKRGISVYGNIEPDLGKAVLYDYVKTEKEIYKPSR